MNSEVKIRKASEQDTGFIFSMIKELAEYEKLSHKVFATEEMLLENIFHKKYAEVILAEYGDQPAGIALFFHNFSTFEGKPGIYLEDIYVRPHLRSKGIGKIMLQYLIDLAKERDCARVEWAVLDWNEPAIKFYKKLGAVPMYEWTVFRLEGLND
jgi:GNAT superfamily N-acetyltransferase